MKKVTTIAAIFCGAFLLTSCDPQPKDTETVIIKENSTKEPVVIEKEQPKQVEEKDGIDVELGTKDDGNVDVKVKGSIKDDN